MTARPSTKRAPRRPSATGGRPSLAERDADDLVESVVRAVAIVVREEFERLRPTIVAGLEAGANPKLVSASVVRRLRARLAEQEAAPEP